MKNLQDRKESSVWASGVFTLIIGVLSSFPPTLSLSLPDSRVTERVEFELRLPKMAFTLRSVKVPPNSASLEEASCRVFDFFRQACRSIPTIMDIYNLDDVVTKSELRSSISSEICPCMKLHFQQKTNQNFLVRCMIVNPESGYNYRAVKRWTSQRKLGYCLLDCDKIFVPIHKDIHWCLAVINKKDQKFQYLDSLKGRDPHVLRALAKYFVEEVKDKSGKDIDISSWEQEFVEDLPAQENGFDCGMFMLKYIDFYSRGLSLCFEQEHMPYFRLRTAKEILKLKAD